VGLESKVNRVLKPFYPQISADFWDYLDDRFAMMRREGTNFYTARAFGAR
jgi:hypothetical protein